MLTGVLISVIPALICITFHELSHGFVAYKLGDPTAKRMGRLTLNPIKHIDVFGLLMMVVFRFGWAKPVPVNMMSFKHPKRYMALTALAGPASNIILAIITLLIYGLTYTALGGRQTLETAGGIALLMIERLAQISVALAVFNIIPIPPLDGSKVLFSVVSDKLYYKLMKYERYGMILLILVVSTSVFSSTVGRATSFLYEKLFVAAEAMHKLVN